MHLFLKMYSLTIYYNICHIFNMVVHSLNFFLWNKMERHHSFVMNQWLHTNCKSCPGLKEVYCLAEPKLMVTCFFFSCKTLQGIIYPIHFSSTLYYLCCALSLECLPLPLSTSNHMHYWQIVARHNPSASTHLHLHKLAEVLSKNYV